MDIEIPIQFYELLLKEAAETDSAVEEITKSTFRKFMERPAIKSQAPERRIHN